MRSVQRTGHWSRPIAHAGRFWTGPIGSDLHRPRCLRNCCSGSRPTVGRTITDAVHRILAYLAVGGVVVGIAWSLVVVLSGRGSGETFVRFQAGVVSLLVVAAASGLVLLAGGARPTDGLHLMYALLAIALVPLARSFLGRATGQRAAVLFLVAFIVLGGVLFRLFTTG